MRRLILFMLVATAMTGCRKMMDKLEKQGQDSAADVPAGGGGAMVLGGNGGGGGGATQAVRGAANRTVTRAEFHDLHLFLTNAKLATGQVPNANDTWAALQRPDGNAKLVALIKDQAIYLVPNPQNEGLWAYSKEAYSTGGLVLTHNGVEQWTSQQVMQALQGG